ncbi:MAG: hypothetical protein GY820_06340, partial [Gammaproteobacteria bacterium]|nr:hypothetical protein [Gammaproteobacteria bacterium]
LQANFSFSPPLSLTGGDRYFALVDLQLESAGILYEINSELEYATPAGFFLDQWHHVENGQTLYCRSIEELVAVLNESFGRIGGGSTDHPKATYNKRSNAVTVNGHGFNVRFSEQLKKILGLESNLVGDHEKKTSVSGLPTPGLPHTLPLYISLDCLDPNAVFPSDKYGKP